MKHKVKVTVIDKKLYPELQQKYCADPNSGMCLCYNVGDEFIFERDEQNDHFWHGCPIAQRHGMLYPDISTLVCRAAPS